MMAIAVGVTFALTWVFGYKDSRDNPDYKKKLKKEAADEGISDPVIVVQPNTV